jgi:hypothetical protein
MPNYYGLVVRATPNQLLEGEAFICVADRADGTCWLIPVNGRSSSDTTKYVPKALWKITVEGEDEQAFRTVIDKLKEFLNIRANDGDWTSKNVLSAKDNLAAAERCYEELYQAVAAPAWSSCAGNGMNFGACCGGEGDACVNNHDELVATPMNAMFGGLPFRILDIQFTPETPVDLQYVESKVGKIIVVEGEGTGEYIVVYESDSAYYAVPTLNVVEGIQIQKVSKDEYTIIDEYKDDGFIAEFVERLEQFGDRDDLDDEEPYAFVTIDSARTTARQLARCLERNGGGVIGAFERFADAICGGR